MVSMNLTMIAAQTFHLIPGRKNLSYVNAARIHSAQPPYSSLVSLTQLIAAKSDRRATDVPFVFFTSISSADD